MTHPSPGKTATVVASILAWQRDHQGQIPYSETDPHRLSSDTAHLTSPTDCSGMVARMFAHFAGIDVGTYTGNECNYGQLVTQSKAEAAAGAGMLPGDVILFNWPSGRSTWDHIAIYAGNGRIWNHGGPGHGPLDWSLASNVGAAVNVMVRRYLSWDTATNPPPSEEDDNMDQPTFNKLMDGYLKGEDANGQSGYARLFSRLAQRLRGDHFNAQKKVADPDGINLAAAINHSVNDKGI